MAQKATHCSATRGFERRLFGRTAERAYVTDYYGVAISPLAVATIQRLPQRTMESIRPIPGTVSPRAAVRTPSGPSRTAVPPRTSRTVQPSIVVGLVSATGTMGSRAVRVVFAWVTGDVLAESERRAPPGDAAPALAKGAPAGTTAGG